MRDFSPELSSFRSFAELCVTRQIITAIKSATRFKHSPLNTYVSFSHTPAGQESEGDCTLGDALPGPSVDDPSVCVISTEELQSLVFTLGTGLSKLEADALKLYLEGESYETMAERLGCDTKTIDNALQRVKRKVLAAPADAASSLLAADFTESARTRYTCVRVWPVPSQTPTHPRGALGLRAGYLFDI